VKTESPFIFLFSSERSGSNLLSSIIGNHSEATFLAPAHLFRLLYLQEEKYQDVEKLKEDVRAIVDVMLGQWNRSIEFDGDSIQTLLTSLYKGQSCKIHVIKELQPWKYLKSTNRDFPHSKIIYSVRDPRDVFVSVKKLPNLKQNARKFALKWAEEQQKSLKSFKELGINFLLVKYESFLENPQKELIRVCDYLGLPLELEMLKFYKSIKSRGQATKIAAWENIDQPLLRDNTNKFYTYLSIEEVRVIEKITFDFLTNWGYEKAESQLFVENPLLIEPYVYSARELFIRKNRQAVLQRIFSTI